TLSLSINLKVAIMEPAEGSLQFSSVCPPKASPFQLPAIHLMFSSLGSSIADVLFNGFVAEVVNSPTMANLFPLGLTVKRLRLLIPLDFKETISIQPNL